mmetsp:Transcript_12034/g.18583  ORF Transcript_12034/g.18583 Transcript_12034/m.18583 type:complete len:122 (+) Transcript_12034:136-501(+)
MGSSSSSSSGVTVQAKPLPGPKEVDPEEETTNQIASAVKSREAQVYKWCVTCFFILLLFDFFKLTFEKIETLRTILSAGLTFFLNMAAAVFLVLYRRSHDGRTLRVALILMQIEFFGFLVQ